MSEQTFTRPGRAPLPSSLHPRGGWRGRRAARALSWIAVALSVLVLLGAAGLYALYVHYNGQIHRVEGLITGQHDAEGAAAGVQNFLLVGSDDRTHLTPEQLREAHTQQDGGAVNTDVLIIMHIDPRKSKVDMISFPRDSFVPVPGWKNPDGTPDRERINSIYALTGVYEHLSGQAAKDAGARKLVESIQDYTGLHIDHYVQIDFGGFLNITKALGGVTVCVAAPHDDRANSGAYFPHAGTYTLDPEQALAFVRERKDLAGGDLDRIQRQKVFFSAVLHQTESAGTWLNPVKLNDVLDAVTSSITADSGLSLSDLKDLVDRLKNLDPAHLSFFTVPIVGPYTTPGGAAVLKVDLAQWKAFFRQFGDDLSQQPTAQPAAGPPLTVAPQQVTVEVRNGSGRAHLGAEVSQALGKDGFLSGGVGNADRSDYAVTEIHYAATHAESARTVAAAIPGSKLVPDATVGSAVVVVVGQNYSSVVPVAVGRPGPPAPAPAPTVTGPTPINPGAVAGASAAQTGCAP